MVKLSTRLEACIGNPISRLNVMVCSVRRLLISWVLTKVDVRVQHLFRTYLADLGEYLTKHVGLCISDTIVAHLLWADDLVLVSASEKGLQEQRNGPQEFC